MIAPWSLTINVIVDRIVHNGHHRVGAPLVGARHHIR